MDASVGGGHVELDGLELHFSEPTKNQVFWNLKFLKLLILLARPNRLRAERERNFVYSLNVGRYIAEDH